MRVVCECGACREIQPQALARLVGWKMTLKELALRMRCSRCGRRLRKLSRLHGLGRVVYQRVPAEYPQCEYTSKVSMTRCREQLVPSLWLI